MIRIVRPALVLLVICGLLTAGALLVGYQSPADITILKTNTWEGIHILEVWDTLRPFTLRLAGTRCYDAASVVEEQPHESLPGVVPSTQYLVQQTNDGAEAVTILKC